MGPQGPPLVFVLDLLQVYDLCLILLSLLRLILMSLGPPSLFLGAQDHLLCLAWSF